MSAKNFFVGEDVAARYATARPALHHRAIEWLSTQIALPLATALDVGCGTGLSTAALAAAADRAVGVDPSRAMLRHARERSSAVLVLGDGNRLPFRSASFDLVTMSSSIHWLSPDGVVETARVVGRAGLLLAYDVWFLARMRDVPEFSDWMHSTSERYPQVQKAAHSREELASLGLHHRARGDLEEWVPIGARELCDYLMTHSERLAAVAEGCETETEQRAYLEDGLASFFDAADTRDVGFALAMDLYERA
jgi:ubiquinone/menaquinone biosynthesis C-methylase UbiE